jgi:hypothetical protein
MKTIRKELIEVRNKLDKLIKQLGTEIVLLTTEKSLENTIFNPRVLKTEKDLYELRQTIANYISGRPTKDEKKIDARTKNQFYLFAALWSLPNVLKDDSMVNFIRQMALWFPEYIPADKKGQRKYERSLSHEKQKWEKDGMLLKVIDWKGFISQNGMQKSKAIRFESLAKEIFIALNFLIKEIRTPKH